MATKSLPPQSVLLQLLRYEPETGKLFWRPRGVEWFNGTETRSAEHSANHWNSVHAGKEAFTCTQKAGHRVGRILGTSYLAHRVIWKMVTGTEPRVIDHSDGVASHNRMENMRDGSQADNTKNARLRTNNRSGTVGVYRHKRSPGWTASIRVNGKGMHLGAFRTFDEAVAARKAAEVKFGFHKNHGRP